MRYARRTRDDGSVLVLTLILVTVMAVVVIALAQYVTVGLTTSDVASERTESNADAANAMNWAIEQFAKKQLRPDDSCGAAPNTYAGISVPTGLASNGTALSLECAQTNPITGEPVVHLIVMSTGVQERMIQATVEVPRYSHGARVSDWRVDIPIAVPEYVTTTTVAPTTTTVAPGPNTAPSASDMSMSVDLDAPFVVTLPAFDSESDPLTVSNLTPAGTELDVTPVSGLDVTVTAESSGGAVLGGTYTFSYTVDDTEPSNVATVTVIVNNPSGGPTTTSTVPTTTVPPMPSCTFSVTSAHQNGKSGSGTLTVTNSGSDFTGWEIRLTQKNSSNPWQFTWGDPSLTVNAGSSNVTVAGSQTVTQTTPFTVTADLTQSNNSAPATAKINVNDSLTCQVLSPS